MLESIDKKTISKNRVNAWLEKLEKSEKYRIFGPVRREGYTEFSHFSSESSLADLDLTIRNTVISPKNIIYSQSLTMMEFKLKKKAPEINVQTDETKQIIIGIRPCDVHGIMAFDPTFDSEFSDPYYKSTRNNTLLVGLACNDMDVNCFCRSLSSGPFDGNGMDIMMVDIGSEYLFYILTEPGRNVVGIASELFQVPSDQQIAAARSLKEKAEEKKTRHVDTQGKPEILGTMFEDDYWGEVARRCLGCGICTYLCPTCYCFDITDEKWGNSGRRMRTWDSCMYQEYTVHASDYNPRPARMNRLRNRFYHKFKYYPDLYNKFGCTGCGRCVRQCPVNIDIIDVINGISTDSKSSDVLSSDPSSEKTTNSGGEQ